ncbi:DUF2341 domain-containing protein [Marinicrinis lubricantis]|uniref:DUF2341 domain-containing protein n=1 Tax=Marinicrinis lubricantis TaxID=2086470 RepID=A0ABW1IT16_9BACL
MRKRCTRHFTIVFLVTILLLNSLISANPGVINAAETTQEVDLIGEGTVESPFQIADEADFHRMSELINSGNEKYTGEKFYVVTNDILLNEPFTPIDRFDGVFDGQGHTISDLRISETLTSAPFDLGMIRVNNGTIRDLGIVDSTVTVVGKLSTYSGGIFAGTIASQNNGIIERVSVINGAVNASGAESAGGITGRSSGEDSAIRDSYFQGSVTAWRQPSGIVGYYNDKGTIERNFVDAHIVSSNAYAGLVVAYPNDITIQNNVVYNGSITGGRENWAHRVIGTAARLSSGNVGNNYVNRDIPPMNNNTGIDVNGIDTTPEELKTQAFYEGIGWDFENVWTFSDKYERPMLSFAKMSQRPDRITVTFHGDTQTRKGFTWYTSVEVDNSVLIVSETGEFTDSIEFGATDTVLSDGVMHKAVATGLKPGTVYYYKVGDKTSNSFSNVGTFTTSGNSDQFTFIHITDTQAKNEAEALLATNTFEEAQRVVPEAAFYLHKGDVVQNGDVESEWKLMLNLPKSVLMNTTIAPAAGNHEYEPNAFNHHFNLEAVNGQDPSTGVYYSFDYGNTHFAVLNTNEDPYQGISDSQLEWLESDIKQARQNGAKWVILSLHKGVYTTANHVNDADVMSLRKILVPLIDELDIDLVLQGHDHILAKSKSLVYDPEGTASAAIADTDTYVEISNGKRIEYAMNPNGTYYFIAGTAGAKHYNQTSQLNEFDLNSYLGLFDYSVPSTDLQHFAKVNVSDSKLTVMTYEIKNGGVAISSEGFGIDREVMQMIQAVDILPAPENAVQADQAKVEEVYAAYRMLNDAQQEAVSNKDKLFAVMKKLYHFGQSDSYLLPWADTEAHYRQSISVHNFTSETYTNAPVLLKLKDIPAGTSSDTLNLFGEDGVRLDYEVESWDPSGVSAVWVRMPELPKNSTTTLWAYYGGSKYEAEASMVWNDSFELVEHFNQALSDGETISDSTGKQVGSVTHSIGLSVNEDGRRMGEFDNAKITYDSIGSDFDKITISAVYKADEKNAEKMNGTIAALVARDVHENPNDNVNAYVLGVDGTNGMNVHGGYTGTWRESAAQGTWKSSDQAIPTDGKSHLLTLTYDGMTVSLYLDGANIYNGFAEKRTIVDLLNLPTTIGAFSNEEMAGAFNGLIDEVWITSETTDAEWESFRYSNLLGNNVGYSQIVSKKDEKISLSLGSPMTGETSKNGKTVISGSVNKPATITMKLNDMTREIGTVQAGSFTLKAPVDVDHGEVLEIIAASLGDSSDTAQSVVSLLEITDSEAPNKPTVWDTSNHGVVTGSEVDLHASIDTDVSEQINVDFYAYETIALHPDNVKVYEGDTAGLPSSTLPFVANLNTVTEATYQITHSAMLVEGDLFAEPYEHAGTVTEATYQIAHSMIPVRRSSTALYNTTSSVTDNVYQIYEVELTEEQLQQSTFHITWKGRSEREVTSYVYDNNLSQWIMTGNAYAPENHQFTIHMSIENTHQVVNNGKLYLLFWRGMTEPIDNRSTYKPALGQYDFSIMAIPDTQLYAQSYPDRTMAQFQWIADHFNSTKNIMALSLGDLVNRPYLRERYQFELMSKAYGLLENKNIPYAITWGNHDYDYGTNHDILYKQYYSADRIRNAGGSYFGSQIDNDAAYYLIEKNGAKIMLLTFPYWAKEAEFKWAENAIALHSDYSVIIATHKYISRYGKIQDAQAEEIRRRLVVPFHNVKMLLNGHDTGTNVHYENINGRPVYSIVTDYQSLPPGGGGFIRNIHFDLENDLVYFNTYSPISGETWSGLTREPVTNPPGFYKTHMDEFVIPVDFGGTQTRTLTTDSLSISSEDPIQIGQSQTITGSGEVMAQLDHLQESESYEWWVRATDMAGNVTDSVYSSLYVTTSQAKAELIAMVHQAESLTNKGLYTAESLEALETALRRAKAVLAASASTEADYASAADTLRIAYGNLKYKPADYTAVESAIAKAKALNPNDYVDFSGVTAAMNAVEYGKDIREQDLVDGYAQAIQAAISALVKKPVRPQPDYSGGYISGYTPEEESTGIDVLVDGVTESMGKATTETVNGQRVTTVTLDPEKLEDILADKGQGAVITIMVNTESDAAIVELNGQMVKSLENKQAVIEVRTERGTYTLPADQINMDSPSSQFGNAVHLKDIKVEIEIAVLTVDELKAVENIAEQEAFTLVAPPLHFTVRAGYGNKVVEVSEFSDYVERTITLPDGVESTQVTTGVVIDPDGQVRHVPTHIAVIDGMTYAKIHSLTNSTYALVSHSAQFEDIIGHWANEAAHDLGSRMIIEGTGMGEFSPNRDVTRAEFAAIIVRALGLKLEDGTTTFSDVNADDWYYGAVQTAYAYDLIEGFGDGSFRPMDRITREQAMVMTAKAMNLTGLKEKLQSREAAALLASFTDASDVSLWAVEGAADSLQAGIVTGRSAETLAPKAFITRAEIAVMVRKLLQQSELI